MSTTAKQKHVFQAEVNEVLSIVVNSLYSNKEVFLRELISNASDAIDKLSFRALTEHGLGGDEELTIDLIPSKTAGTLTIRDNGIGMTRDEVIANLGTVAKSGSKALMQSLSGDEAKDLSLIGQFGVGFYSAFLVSDRVTVTTRAAADVTAGVPGTAWESEAKGEFTVGDSEREPRGTHVILQLKDDEKDYLDEWTLKSLVRKYSDYVRYPIRLQVEREKKKDDDAEPEKVLEWETVNSASALWTRPKSEIADEQYAEFYKHLSHDWNEPLAHTHFKIEGTHELTGLLFVPAQKPLDMFERKARGLRLFVKRVFVMDDCEDVLPEWLRFLHGILDSEDLPLNVSREILQQDRTTGFMRKQVILRSLTLLEELADEGETTKTEGEGDDAATTTVHRYHRFWSTFGHILKEGVHHDPEHKDRIARLLRYHSTHGEGLTSLADYVGRMKDDQPGIYFLTAANLVTARSSPHIESLTARGYEVLLMTDPVDEWIVDRLTEFDDKKLIAAAKGALDVPETDEEKKAKEEKQGELSDVMTRVQSALGDHVKEVRVTSRLTDSPACLVSDPHGMSPHHERMLRAYGHEVPPQKRILEINPDHPVVQELERLAGDEAHQAEFEQWAQLVFDQALVAEGCLPDDPAKLARSIAALMRRASAAKPDA